MKREEAEKLTSELILQARICQLKPDNFSKLEAARKAVEDALCMVGLHPMSEKPPKDKLLLLYAKWARFPALWYSKTGEWAECLTLSEYDGWLLVPRVEVKP